MGRDSQTSEIECLPLAICGGGFLRFILKDFGYALDNGIVLVADDDMQARQFMMEYSKRIGCAGCMIKSWKKRRVYPKNYCCGFLAMRKAISQEEVDDFLVEQTFLPVVICGGLFPDYLRTDHYIFRMNKVMSECAMSQDFWDKMEKFCNYVKENIDEVCNVLEELKTCIAITEYEGPEEMRTLYNFLIGVGFIFSAFLRKTQTERIALDFFLTYKKVILGNLSHMQDFASGEILKEVTTSLVWDYLYQNNGVVIADLEAVETTAYAAIKAKKAILFDNKFYYFSPELFVKIFEPLLQIYSETVLKKQLKADGIIYCNFADYTVKKAVTNAYGITKRERFIWVHKEVLLSQNNLLLEDIFYHESEEEIE